MEVLVEFNNENYIAIYNEDTGYFELDLTAPENGGIYDIKITGKDILDNKVEEIEKIQILTIKEEKVTTDKVVAYFLDRFSFEITDVADLQDYEINIDEETNSKSNLIVMKKLNANDKDFIFINENGEIKYIGIIDAPLNDNGETKYTITAKYITNLFDRDILVNNEELISTTGIEDFIKYTIENEFTKSNDSLLNMNYLDVEVLTHTKINKSIDNVENGIYNFHTFITNCSQNYNIVYTFKVENGRLKMAISKQEQEVQLIDTTITDITNYTEVFETNVVAKVIVKTSNNLFNYFLLNNRTTTTDINDENRAIGLIKTIYTEKDEDAQQTALNEFKSNSYEHLIQFDVNNESNLFDIKNWKIGTPIKMKTKNNVIIDSYISAISMKKGSKFYSIKTGNIRINFIDKIKKELKN